MSFSYQEHSIFLFGFSSPGKKKKGKRKRKTMPFLFVLFANAYFRKISSEEGDINVLIRTL